METQLKRPLTLETVPGWRRGLHGLVVATNGCFDILHVGHVRYLKNAALLGDHLIVGLNSDESVRLLKGPDRPVNGYQERAEVLLALDCVDAVVVFDDLRADRFLAETAPDVWVKGGDYTIDSLNSAEVEAAHAVNAEIVTVDFVNGYSTSEFINRMQKT